MSGTSYGPGGGGFVEALISRSIQKGVVAASAQVVGFAAIGLATYGLAGWGFSVDAETGTVCVSIMGLLQAVAALVASPAAWDQIKRRFLR